MKNFLLRNFILIVILILVTIGAVNMVMNPGAQTQRLTYPQYKEKLAKGQISEVVVRAKESTYHIEGKFKGNQEKAFVTQGPKGSIVVQDLNKAEISKVTYEKQSDSVWLTFFTSFLPFVIILLLLFFFLNRARSLSSQVVNFGKSHFKLYNVKCEPRGGQG